VLLFINSELGFFNGPQRQQIIDHHLLLIKEKLMVVTKYNHLGIGTFSTRFFCLEVLIKTIFF